ncbi:MAG: acyloxyacyl hydrolase [Tenuifilaceae bacterium]|nr:acyloxyacyl hydrolase [Tenuifilaceae bacterium]
MIKQLAVLSLALLYCCIATPASADTTTIAQGFGLKVHTGVLLDHHKEMEILRRNPASAIEVSYILKGNGEKLWHKFYGYPRYGVSYFFMDMGNREILGYSHAIYPFINLPIYSPGKNLNLGFMVGSGLGYAGKTYHRTQNFKNTAISSHLNAIINLSATLSYCISNHVTLNANLSLIHLSNGSIKKPNYGLNYTLLSLGIQYGNFNAKPKNHEEKKVRSEKHRILLAISGSTKQAVAFNDPNFCVASGSIEYSHKVWSPLFRVGGSLDFMYDNSHSLILHNHSIAYGSDWELAKLGMAVNAELILNRLSLILHFGGYYHNLSRKIKNQWVYQRVGLRYRFTNGLWAHVALKTHLNIADYIEFGLAFKLF